ncbi:MAG: D-2-hydroxyacid dehydrogenase [Oscillospiraceae bacterium]|nr:D-2-hydroxyacid dehydrogenase [Oscillospiraceae bacterium]
MRELLIMTDFSAASLEKIQSTVGNAFRVTVLPSDGEPMPRYAAFRTAEVIIGEPSAEELELVPLLRWLQITWSGADRYTKAATFPAGVMLTSATGAFGVTISEYVLGSLLALCRRLPVYRSYQLRGVSHSAGAERLLSGGTALILGTGDIGTHVARRLKAFDMRVIGVCRQRRPLPPEFDEVWTLREAERLLPEADVVVCCLPETAETRRYFDRERLLLLKQDAILVNVGRGSLIVADDLAEVMEGGHLFGAALDVTDPEPLPKEHPLRKLRNVILTPHVAGIGFGAAEETERKIAALCCDNLRRYLNGWPLRNQVDFATGYRRK